MRVTSLLALLLLVVGPVWSAQQTVAQREGQDAPPVNPRATSAYVLGPDDVIVIRAFEVEEISEKPFRIDSNGTINLPLLGRIKAEGLSVEKLETALAERLKTHVKIPQVAVTIAQFRTSPVFMVGAFKTPGVYPLRGRQTLVEMLSTVGGLQPNASRRLRLTRRLDWGRIPLPNAAESPERGVSEVEISMSRLMETVNPAEDLVLYPYDVIRVAPREMVYVNGEVQRPGTFDLQERESLSVAQAITMAGGLSREARPERAVVLRPVLDTAKRAEIPVDVKTILAGKANDFPLLANDVLVVPRRASGRRAAVGRVLLYAVPAAITSTIYVLVRR